MTTPATPEDAVGEVDVEGIVAKALAAHHWGDDTSMVGYVAMQCGCGWKATDAASRIYSLRARHDQHRAEALAPDLLDRLRVVEGERDAAVDDGVHWHAIAESLESERDEFAAARDMALRMHDVQHDRANRERARAESAEAAHAALVAGIEGLCDPSNDGPRPYAVAVGDEHHVVLAVDVDILRALLTPTAATDTKGQQR